jgi:hypothetical protein
MHRYRGTNRQARRTTNGRQVARYSIHIVHLFPHSSRGWGYYAKGVGSTAGYDRIAWKEEEAGLGALFVVGDPQDSAGCDGDVLQNTIWGILVSRTVLGG